MTFEMNTCFDTQKRQTQTTSKSKCIINCKQPMNSLLRSQSIDLNQGLQDDYFTRAKENCK